MCLVPLPPPEALKILTEKDHAFLFWKSLAVREKGFNDSRVSGLSTAPTDTSNTGGFITGCTLENAALVSASVACRKDRPWSLGLKASAK